MATRAKGRGSKTSKSSKAGGPSPTERQLEQLEAVAETLGVTVSYESMTGIVAGSGGLCRVKGSYRIIIDRRLQPRERLQMLSEALRRFDLSATELPDTVRELLLPLTA